MSLLKNDYVGVLPYSLFNGQPIALIWKHCKTSLITRASSDFYTELILRNRIESDEETNYESIARVLSKISNGSFTKSSSKSMKSTIKDSNNDQQKACYSHLLSSIKKIHGIAILENDCGYQVLLVPVKYTKIKRLQKNIQSSKIYEECHWIFFNELLLAIHNNSFTDEISKTMSVSNIENHTKNKNYAECHLSLQFAAMLRNSHQRCILPLFQEIKITLSPLNMSSMNANNNRNIDVNDDGNEDEQKNIILLDDIQENEKESLPMKFTVKCKKCRLLLFNDNQFEDHSRKSISDQCSMHVKVCNCIFLDGEISSVLDFLSTMSDLTQMSGVLHCPKCNSKVGRFNYCGSQCSCDEWICPSYQISVSKVDIQRIGQQLFRHVVNNSKYFEK